MLNLRKLVKDYEDSARSFNELVPWMGMISPEMVLNKDGSLLVAYEFTGMDAEGKERRQIDHTTRMVEQAMRVFGERVTVWYFVDRRRTTEYPDGSFDNEYSAYVDAVWRESITSGNQYQNFHYLAILYTPPKGVEGALEKLAHFVKVEEMPIARAISETIKSSIFRRAAFAYEANQLDALVKEFMTTIASFEETAGELKLKQLAGEELLGFLYARCNPASSLQRVKVPSVPMYLDTLLPNNLLVSRGDTLLFKGPEKQAHVAAVSIKDWPEMTEPQLLDGLLAIPGELTVSQVFRFTDQEKSRQFIQGVERHNRNLMKSLKTYIAEAVTKEDSGKLDHGRMILADDARDALTEITTDNRVYGHYNLTVLAKGETLLEAEATLKMISQTLRQRMYVVIRETMHLLSAFAGTMPGQAGALVRWFFVSGGNVADLAPLYTMSTGQRINKHFSERAGYEVPALTVLPTEFNTPYFFNFHQADLAHTMVVGPSRSGKSVFDNFLISQFQKYRNAQTFIFDKDYSCRIPTLLQGGEHIDLAGDHDVSGVKLNPMMLLSDKDNWPWLANWISLLITSRGYEMTAEDDKAVWDAIEGLAEQPESDWTLRMYSPLLNSRELSSQLQQWIGSGPKARFFDNTEDTFDLAAFTCIEMNRLFQDEPVARAFMEYAFYRIFKRLDGRPTLIYIEEAWFMLGDERFAKRLDDWLRTLAKKNAFLIMATQSLSEIASSKYFSTLIDNIPNRIFLPNDSAFSHFDMYTSKFGLNHAQVERIRTAIPKLNYYIVTPRLSRMVSVPMPKEILAIMRSDDMAQAVFNKHIKSGESEWKRRYLDDMIEGVPA